MNTKPAFFIRTLLISFIWLAVITAPARAQSPQAEANHRPPLQTHACSDGTQTSGALYRICTPFFSTQNQLIVFASGYAAPNKPLALPPSELGGVSLEQAVNLLGYAFATTSYSTTGLAVQAGIADLVDLVAIYKQKHGTPNKVILVGVSEGGLITVLALERHPEVFSGGLALCGPYGSFRDQINYFGDFRTVFDYYFPGLTPGTPIDIPPAALDTWESATYSTTVQPVVVDPANAAKVDELLAVTEAPFDSADAASKEQTINQLLWYNVYATNDARSKLGGQPFDNQNRPYSGSSDDTALNAAVLRFSAEVTATTAISLYETTGQLTRPLITLHTDRDPVVPNWHAALYRAKTNASANPNLHEDRSVTAYGHCRFGQADITGAFNRLEQMIANPPPKQRVYLPVVSRN